MTSSAPYFAILHCPLTASAARVKMDQVRAKQNLSLVWQDAFSAALLM